MNQFEGELAALQHQRKMEAIGVSPAAATLGSFAGIADKLGVPGAGLFAKVLKSGQTPVEKIVEQIEIGAYSEIARIEKRQDGHEAQCDQRFNDFQERLQSVEAQNAYFSAILHGLRTSDPKKQFRLGALTINCIYTNDTQPESLDDMMRAVVELKDKDLQVLKEIYELHRQFYSHPQQDSESRYALGWNEKVRNGPLGDRGALARLQAHGFISYHYQQKASGEIWVPGPEPHDLNEDGIKLYERLQKIAADPEEVAL